MESQKIQNKYFIINSYPKNTFKAKHILFHITYLNSLDTVIRSSDLKCTYVCKINIVCYSKFSKQKELNPKMYKLSFDEP